MEYTENIAQTVTAIVLGIVTLIFTLQKLLKGWKETSAETSVISLMHEELERMSVQNKALSDELVNLQTEIVNLGKQLRQLSEENQRLHHEINILTNEVTRLQNLLKSHNIDDFQNSQFFANTRFAE